MDWVRCARCCMGFGIRSIMVVPVVRGDRVLGSFSLDAIRGEREFTDDDVAFCQVLAAALGTAIENAQLYQGSEHRAELLSGLDEAARNLREERQTEKVLQAVVRLAARLLGCEMGLLWFNRAAPPGAGACQRVWPAARAHSGVHRISHATRQGACRSHRAQR